jgi:hypothetical protein
MRKDAVEGPLPPKNFNGRGRIFNPNNELKFVDRKDLAAPFS